MKKYFFFTLIILFLFIESSNAQYNSLGIPFAAPAAGANIPNTNINQDMYRNGRVGYGFPNFGSFLSADPMSRARLTVREGIIAHYVNGSVGQLDNAKWCGLGIGNPGGGPSPYGLAIADNNNVGFYNILFNDVIAGFGSATATATNRFRIRAYNTTATNPLNFKDILVADPRGAVGINDNPIASLYVNSAESSSSIFKAIAIEGVQVGSTVDSRTASGMGNQQNSSLASDDVVVEGIRSQFPNFANFITGNPGAAVNLQTVKFDDQPNSAIPRYNTEYSYAELAWQDLEYNADVTTDPNLQPIRPLNFYISFRNGRSGVPGDNSFSVNNKLPVTTFTPLGRVGIATTDPINDFGGDPVFLDVNGSIFSSGNYNGSDIRYKKEINPIIGALDKIKMLQGTTYKMRHEEFPNKNFMKGMQYGYIAQDLEKVIPELAKKGSDGYYGVNYVALIPILSEAVKELDNELTILRTELASKDEEIIKINAELQAIRNEIKGLSSSGSFSDKNGYELLQNTPNPTGSFTSIRYKMPRELNFNNATINIYDLTGKMIESYRLNDNNGELRINVTNLISGTYLYDLLIDGRQIDLKKMVVIKS